MPSSWSTPAASTTASPPWTTSRPRRLPFIVAINQFDDAQQFGTEEIREALAISAHIPIITVDARNRESAKQALVRITEFSLMQLAAAAQQGVPQPAHR